MWQRQLGQEYEFLSDAYGEAARAFDVDLEPDTAPFGAPNTRGAFLVDRDGTVRYAFRADELSRLPPVAEALEATRGLV